MCLWLSTSVFRILSDIYDGVFFVKFEQKFFCEIWANLSKLVPKFSSRFVRFDWEYAHWSLRRYLTHFFFQFTLFLPPANIRKSYSCLMFSRGREKGCFRIKWVHINLELFPEGSHNHTVFHNTDSPWFLFNWFV